MVQKLRRKSFGSPIVAAGLLIGIVFSVSTRAEVAHEADTRSRRLIIIPKNKAGARESLRRMHRQNHAVLRNEFHALGGVQVIELPPGRTKSHAFEDYHASGFAEFVEPDYPVHAFAEPNDPQFGELWALNNTGQINGVPDADIDGAEAWDHGTSASSVIVAVIDSGIRYTHEDLAANMWRNPREVLNGRDDDRNGIIDDIHGFNALDDSGDPIDDTGHGTHIAGIIGAVGNNGKGITGVAWSVQLMACKFLDDSGNGYVSDAIACINYARRKKAKVINASWGMTNYSAALEIALRYARAAGVIVVTAAGNRGIDIDVTPVYPASSRSRNVVTVAGSSTFDLLDASYSNYGLKSVDLVAPGTRIRSASHTSDDAYVEMTGTSMAAPHVAGAFALLKAKFPQRTHAQLIARLLNHTDRLPALSEVCATGGRLNVANALSAPGLK